MIRPAVLLCLLCVPPTPLATAQAQAQPSPAADQGPRAVIYRDINFRGPAVVLTGAESHLRLKWPIRSIRVERGTWELCRNANFHGRCARYDASDTSIPSAVEYTQSARPAAPRG